MTARSQVEDQSCCCMEDALQRSLNLEAFWVLDVNGGEICPIWVSCKLLSITSINLVKKERSREFWLIFIQKMVTFSVRQVFHKKTDQVVYLCMKSGSQASLLKSRVHWPHWPCDLCFRSLWWEVHFKQLDHAGKRKPRCSRSVSYTHLTLPTKRIV